MADDTKISTSYLPDRSMVQTMPGAMPMGDLPAGLIALLQARKAIRDQAAAEQQVMPESIGARIPQASAGGGSRRDTSSMLGSGSAPATRAPREISRWVPDPFANPYAELTSGIKPRAVKERYIDGRWEFEDIRPQGPTGRLDMGNEANAGAHYGAADDPRMQALVGMQSGARYEPAARAQHAQESRGGGQTQTDTGYTSELQAQQNAAEQRRTRSGAAPARIRSGQANTWMNGGGR